MGTPYYNSAGLTPEDVYDPDVVGDGPEAVINGFGYRRADGVLLRFAKLQYGTAAANHGYRLQDGRDFSALWAKKGTAVYTFPFNGQRYSSGGGRAGATTSMTFSSDGTWSISAQTGTPLSGNWLVYGGTAADYTVQFVMSGFVSGPDPEGGSNSWSNGASTPVSLTTTRACSCGSVAGTVGASAGNSGTVTVKLFKSGVLVNTSTCTLSTDSAG